MRSSSNSSPACRGETGLMPLPPPRRPMFSVRPAPTVPDTHEPLYRKRHRRAARGCPRNLMERFGARVFPSLCRANRIAICIRPASPRLPRPGRPPSVVRIPTLTGVSVAPPSHRPLRVGERPRCFIDGAGLDYSTDALPMATTGCTQHRQAGWRIRPCTRSHPCPSYRKMLPLKLPKQ